MGKSTKQKNLDKKLFKPKLILAIQLITLGVTSLVFTYLVTHSIEKATKEQYITICEDRAQIVLENVEKAHQILTDYSEASEIKEVVANPTSEKAINAAQAYTSKFSANIENLEGIYVSKWSTEVLAHTNPALKGVITRKDKDSLDALHESLLASPDGFYDTGIIKSPVGEQEQIISLYKIIYDNSHQPVGLVGLGLYTKDLDVNLDSLADSTKGVTFSLIDVNNEQFIFSSNKDWSGAEVEDGNLKMLSRELAKSTTDKSGTIKSSDGLHHMFFYLADRGWLVLSSAKYAVFYASSLHALVQLFWLLVIMSFIIYQSNREFIKHEEDAKRLLKTTEKVEKVQTKLVDAVYSDLLTGLSNRNGFINDLNGINPTAACPTYFVYFNIVGFNDLNLAKGTDAGDLVLIEASRHLNAIFETESYKVYRVGGDEFMIPISLADSPDNHQVVTTLVSTALTSLSSPVHLANDDVVQPLFKCVMSRTTKTVDASILPQLKSLLGNVQAGGTAYIDLDAQ